MQVTENGITLYFNIDPSRFAPETHSILGGESLTFSVAITPVQLNTSLQITFFEDTREYIPEISSLKIDKVSGVGTFTIKTHRLATKGILTLNLFCVTGKQKAKKIFKFNLVSEFQKGSRKENSQKLKNRFGIPSKKSHSKQETKKTSKDNDPFSLTLPGIFQLATDDQKTKPKWVPKNVSDDDDEGLSQILDDPVMQDVSSETPVFLIPCQIETRLFPDTLKIRIYPDQIAIDSLQRKLTKDEMQHGKEFCLDDDPEAAWRHLTKSYNPGRAAWIVKEATEHKSKIGGPNYIYSYRNPEDLKFPTLKLLPAFFVVSLHLDNGEVIRVVGNEITSSTLK